MCCFAFFAFADSTPFPDLSVSLLTGFFTSAFLEASESISRGVSLENVRAIAAGKHSSFSEEIETLLLSKEPELTTKAASFVLKRSVSPDVTEAFTTFLQGVSAPLPLGMVQALFFKGRLLDGLLFLFFLSRSRLLVEMLSAVLVSDIIFVKNSGYDATEFL